MCRLNNRSTVVCTDKVKLRSDVCAGHGATCAGADVDGHKLPRRAVQRQQASIWCVLTLGGRRPGSRRPPVTVWWCRNQSCACTRLSNLRMHCRPTLQSAYACAFALVAALLCCLFKPPKNTCCCLTRRLPGARIIDVPLSSSSLAGQTVDFPASTASVDEATAASDAATLEAAAAPPKLSLLSKARILVGAFKPVYWQVWSSMRTQVSDSSKL